MPFDYYLQRGGQRLRLGYTTGTCAALATQAATHALLGGHAPTQASLMTPKGLEVAVDIADMHVAHNAVSCAVAKDAGDDSDATDGLLIYARVSKSDIPGIHIDGGKGVGRVTRPGLQLPIGQAAINNTPRAMISEQAAAIAALYGYFGGLDVLISIPRGEEVAAQTFNPNLGIEGGLSILGTSGIVEPQSVQALVDTIAAEMRMNAAEGHRQLLLTPGNYGENFIAAQFPTQVYPMIKCSNYIGDSIDLAVDCGYEILLLIGHIGKIIKLAAGIMNTHSHNADGRAEVITAHAALQGIDQGTAEALMHSVTTDAALDILDNLGLREVVCQSIIDRVQYHIARRSRKQLEIGAMIFSNQHGLLASSAEAQAILQRWQIEDHADA